MQWAVNARRDDLLKKKNDEDKDDWTRRLNKNNVMCAIHFEASQFTKSKKRLISAAVPTIFDIPNPPKKIDLKRPPPTERHDPPKPKKMKKEKASMKKIGNKN